MSLLAEAIAALMLARSPAGALVSLVSSRPISCVLESRSAVAWRAVLSRIPAFARVACARASETTGVAPPGMVGVAGAVATTTGVDPAEAGAVPVAGGGLVDV